MVSKSLARAVQAPRQREPASKLCADPDTLGAAIEPSGRPSGRQSGLAVFARAGNLQGLRKRRKTAPIAWVAKRSARPRCATGYR